MATLGHTFAQKLTSISTTYVFHTAIVLYVLLRVIFIIRFPIFNDEALTIRYGKIMVETNHRFYTVAVGGKQPLLYWVNGIMSHVIPDPLLSGRFISFVFGIGTITGIFYLTKLVASRQLADFAILAYAVSPLNIFYDGLAIHDAALACLFCWILYFIILLNKNFSYVSVMAIGILLGIGLWIKTTALLFFVVVLLLMGYLAIVKRITFTRALISILLWFVLVIVMTLPLIARPEFAGVLRMQKDYAMTMQDLAQLPLDVWYSNARNAILIYVGYVTPAVPVSLFYVLLKYKNNIGVRLLLLSFTLSFLLLVLTGRSLHGRYVVFSVIPLIPLFVLIKKYLNLIFIGSLIFMTALSIILSVYPNLFFHLYPNKWVYSFERFQYIDGWPSGYGVKEALRFVDSHRKGKDAYIGVRWDAGNPEDTILLYAPKLPGVVVSFFDKRLPEYQSVIEQMKMRPMYFITRNDQRGDMDANLTLLNRFYKPSGGESVEVYQFHQ